MKKTKIVINCIISIILLSTIFISNSYAATITKEQAEGLSAEELRKRIGDLQNTQGRRNYINKRPTRRFRNIHRSIQ